MRVFLCWSGDRSKAVAEVLGHWIGQVIQAVEPWISTQTDKGARWRTEIGDHLEEAKVGIACLTPENLDSPWIHFESGALSKTKDAHVFTFLLDLQPTDVKEPLAQFQATKAEEDDVRQLIRTINKLVGQTGGRTLLDSDLDEIFNHDWPRLKEKLGEISPRQIRETPFRPEGEMLQEILELVRGIEQSQYRGEPFWKPFFEYYLSKDPDVQKSLFEDWITKTHESKSQNFHYLRPLKEYAKERDFEEYLRKTIRMILEEINSRTEEKAAESKTEGEGGKQT